MENLNLERQITGLLVIDPYNDFISEGGKIWDRIRAVAEANDCVPHIVTANEVVDSISSVKPVGMTAQ